MMPLYSKIFSDSVKYLKKVRSDKKSKKRIDKTISPDYDKFLDSMQQTFYVTQEKECILNKELMAADQREEFDKIEQELLEKQKKSAPIPNQKKSHLHLVCYFMTALQENKILQ
ncbi:hypothetical protein MHK_008813 [Candidatus Magnetomorum sp. HK-1]|nr:hypothetical protein MHK_008813 [Candidatus Magnetomorum sp. HK-1]